jgi:hypothetical protein
MPDVSVGIYSIRVYDSKMNEEIFVEDNSYSLSLSQLIKDYFKTMKSKGRIYNKSQSLVMIDELLENNDKYISGVMKTGEYGYEEEFYEVSSNENTKEDTEGDILIEQELQRKFVKPKDMAGVLPFVFSFYITNHGNKKLYVALERFGSFGIKTKIQNELNKFLRQQYPEYNNLKITLNDLIAEKVIANYYEQEGMRSLKFTRYELPVDIAEKIRNNGADPKDYMIEFTVKPKRRGLRLPTFKSIQKFFSTKNKDIHSILEIKHNKELEYDNIAATLMVNGKAKKIDFSNFMKFKAYEVIKVEQAETGHPVPRDLLEKMKEKLEEAIKEIELV